MYRDLTQGSITKGLLLFAAPMVAGNLLQQLYNIADTLIVGQALGRNALASVGSAFTLMTFLPSVFLGLSMGSGALFSIYLGRGNRDALRRAVAHAFVLILLVTLVLTLTVYLFIDPVLRFLQIPQELYAAMRTYLLIIFAGLAATFLYNFFACLLRAAGNSVAPLWFLGAAALLNIGLDLLFVLGFGWGVAGPAADADLRAGRGDGSPCRRGTVSADRGRFLRRHRLPVPALWLLPGGQVPRHERRPDGDLSGGPRGAGLYAGRAGRPAGHLGRHSHRLGSGRRRGIWVLLPLPRPASG